VASPAGQFRPWRLITAFAILVIVLYGLVFGTKGSNAPKLGIDLQGGTQITLTAETLDKKAPSSSAMQQAQEIMTRRVNGSGVVGAQVAIEGRSNLIVTVPGNNSLAGLTAPARLNIRPHVAQGYDYDVVSAAQNAPTSGAVTSGAKTSGAKTSGVKTPGAATSGAATTAKSGAVVGEPGSTAATPAPATSPQGLRAAAAATTTAATTAAPTTAASAPVGGAPAAPAPKSSAAAASAAPTAPAKVVKSAWPLPNSNPQNPDQPASAAVSAAWVTAATTAVTNNSVSCKDVEKTQGLDVADLPLLACGGSDPSLQGSVLLLDKTLIPGDQISSASSGLNQQGQGWIINVTFDSAGYKTWANYTANNIKKQTAFTLDGVVISDPEIQQAITTTTTQISGTFTQASATDLANSLNFGALPLNFSQGTSTSISAELGSQYLDAGLIAGGIGLLLVVIYCLVYYRLLGLITIGSLVLSGGLVYGIMVLLGRWIDLSLDLAGVAGLIVAIGITADSFVIYFERLKDEVREGRTFRSAVPRGWERAKRTILSADAVSFLSALILYLVAIGDVKGFAFTLGLSTILDLVVVYLVTHPLVALASGSRIFNSARFSGLGAVAAAGARQRAATARLTAKEA
jgi:preprotein translocase subunit SecD